LTPLLFIKHRSFNARTVENDITILSEKFKVKKHNVNTSKGVSFFTALIFEFWYLLFAIYKYKIVFIWFADYHSLLPVFFSKLFGKKCIINIGGYDADEILIGKPAGLKAKFRKFCVSYSVKNASLLLPVSDVIKGFLETAVSENKCKTVYCCVDTDKFPPPENIPEKDNLIVTVGGGGEYIKEAERKRLDFFISLGEKFNKQYPAYNAEFYLIGHNDDTNTYRYLSNLIKSDNIEIKPLTKTVYELMNYYKKASIYMQLSYYEAFGIAQVEAMLQGCIPVSNAGGAIPEVVGDAGFVLKDYPVDEYLRVIKEILDKKHEGLRQKAISRALTNFSLQSRKQKLLEIIEKLIN